MSILRKQFILLALSTLLAIMSYWIPLPRESHGLQPETLPEKLSVVEKSSVVIDAT
jgi:hypothetical protein